MFNVYLDDILQNGADIKSIFDVFNMSFIREDGFQNSSQILREKSECVFEFKGAANTYICTQRKNNPCKQISFKLTQDCGDSTDIVFEGLISQSDIGLDVAKCTGKVTAIKDNSFSGLIRDYMNIQVPLYSSVTKGCQPLSGIDRTLTMYNDPANLSDTSDRLAFDSFDILNFIVKYFTDNAIEVRSTWLTNNRKSITLGYNLHNDTGTRLQIYPKLSMQYVFDELRKKDRIYMVIEYDGLVPYLRIEQESYSYDSTTTLLTIPKVPLTAVETIDYSRYFNGIKVGSNDTKLQDEEAVPDYPQNELTAWQSETYNSCSDCIADKDSEGVVLNLLSDIIIDSNVIFEALNAGADYAHDEDLFMFEYEVNGSGISVAKITSRGGTEIYNDNLRNENVINNWLGYTPLCITLTNSTANYFLANRRDDVIGTGTFPDADFEFFLRFDNEIIDNGGNYLYPYIDAGSPSFGNPISQFIFPVSGDYRFNLKQGVYISSLDCLNILDSSEYRLFIKVYDSGGVLLNSYYSPTIIKENNTDVLRLDWDTPIISATATDQAFIGIAVVMSANCGSPGATFKLIDGYWSLTADSTGCDNLTNDQEVKPFVLEFDYVLCHEDFKRIKTNKRGKIVVKNNDYYIKEIKYIPMGISKLTLMGSESICGSC